MSIFRLNRFLLPAVLMAALGACAGAPVAQKAPAPAEPPIQYALMKTEAAPKAEETNPYAFAGVPQFGKAILVNIPSFELIAFEDGKPVLRSRVIIGKPSTPTPIMRTETSVVRFRPTWTPTPRMIKQGYRPGTRRGGKGNPLGYLAVRLEPGMLIYLHGTNKPHLFKRDKRALSHGCVRVDKWAEVAAWVLDTDVEEVHKRAFGRRTHDVGTGGIPVIVGYHTQFPDAEGVMQQYRDVYRRGTYAAETPRQTAG